MGNAKIFCDECNKWYTVEFTLTSDLFDIECPKCKGNQTWIGDVENDEPNNNEIVLGRGGRGTNSIGD